MRHVAFDDQDLFAGSDCSSPSANACKQIGRFRRRLARRALPIASTCVVAVAERRGFVEQRPQSCAQAAGEVLE